MRKDPDKMDKPKNKQKNEDPNKTDKPAKKPKNEDTDKIHKSSKKPKNEDTDKADGFTTKQKNKDPDNVDQPAKKLKNKDPNKTDEPAQKPKIKNHSLKGTLFQNFNESSSTRLKSMFSLSDAFILSAMLILVNIRRSGSFYLLENAQVWFSIFLFTIVTWK